MDSSPASKTGRGTTKATLQKAVKIIKNPFFFNLFTA